MKRKIAAALATTLTIGLLAGTVTSAQAEESKLDLSQEENLIMYIIGDRPAGQDVVDENVNRLLK